MLQFTNQELLLIIRTKWEAEQNLQEIPFLIEFISDKIPGLSAEAEERFTIYAYRG